MSQSQLLALLQKIAIAFSLHQEAAWGDHHRVNVFTDTINRFPKQPFAELQTNHTVASRQNADTYRHDIFFILETLPFMPETIDPALRIRLSCDLDQRARSYHQPRVFSILTTEVDCYNNQSRSSIC